ncbi:MAG: phosphoglycerate dehydrogenase [Xanthomonadales bacterium]|nr:phosphoglycerate dehydrogenase [Xanthomonadales bacterium]
MFQIQTYNNIATQGLERFPPDRFQVGTSCANPDAIMLRSHNLHGETLPGSVVAVARAGAGVNNIPVEQYSEQGVVVFNTPGANANAVKELIAAALLLASRDVFGGMNYVRSLGEVSDEKELSRLLESEKKRFAGSEVRGKTLGVVGLGAIGSLVANMGLDLGMRVVGYDPAISVEAAWRLSSQVVKMDTLSALLGEADFVTLHVPDIEQTRHLINSESLTSLKPGARILNFAREKIVDGEALVAALDSGRVGGYVTDFPTPALLGRQDVLLFPHIGASTREAEENCAVMAADQLIDFLEHGNVVNSVNLPRVHMSRNGGRRLTFCNDNVPGVLGHVLSLLADNNSNVIDLVNKSHDNFAYNIIDVDDAPSAELVAAINAVDHVTRVRVL